MAAKGDKEYIKLLKIPTDKVSIDHKQWKDAMKNKERSNAVLWDITLDIMLVNIIVGTFPRQNFEDVQKLMDGINMVQKARLAYILELINKTVLNDLEQIHEIRNKFSHSFDASFAYTKVLKLVQKLSTAKGQKVTEENSYKFYESAVLKCTEYIMAVFNKQELEQTQKG